MNSPTLTTYQRVQQACSPQDAMLAIATALDDLLQREAAPAPDAWGQWTNDNGFAPIKPEKITDVGRAQRIAAVQAQLDAAHDPEDVQALAAELRLLKDSAANVVLPQVAEGQRVHIAGDGETGVVDFTAVSAERQDARRQWAARVKLHEFIPLGAADAQDNFAKGGPMWLYLGNRAAVMAMPLDWRRWLVSEVAQDSPAEAAEMGRDILKSSKSIGVEDFKEYIAQVSE